MTTNDDLVDQARAPQTGRAEDEPDYLDALIEALRESGMPDATDAAEALVGLRVKLAEAAERERASEITISGDTQYNANRLRQVAEFYGDELGKAAGTLRFAADVLDERLALILAERAARLAAEAARDNATRELERCRNRSVEMVAEVCARAEAAEARLAAVAELCAKRVELHEGTPLRPYVFVDDLDAALAVVPQPEPATDHDKAALATIRALLSPEAGMATTPFGDGKRYFAEDDIQAALEVTE